MKSIETKWKGWRFRSRTEARWAVFLEAVGISFEYEPEGVILSSGPYLPDFRFELYSDFRKSGGEPIEVVAQCWLEIKGQTPTEDELKRCSDLAIESRAAVLLAVGAPDARPQIYEFSGHPHGEGFDALCRRYDGLATFAACSERGGIGLAHFASRPTPDPETGEIYPPSMGRWFGHQARLDPYPRCTSDWRLVISPELQRAYDAARSARFEFGETDKRWGSE